MFYNRFSNFFFVHFKALKTIISRASRDEFRFFSPGFFYAQYRNVMFGQLSTIVVERFLAVCAAHNEFHRNSRKSHIKTNTIKQKAAHGLRHSIGNHMSQYSYYSSTVVKHTRTHLNTHTASKQNLLAKIHEWTLSSSRPAFHTLLTCDRSVLCSHCLLARVLLLIIWFLFVIPLVSFGRYFSK